MDDEGGGDFEGAFRERAAPKVPPRRGRRGLAEADDTQGDAPEPTVKKTAVWGDDSGPAAVAQPAMGRRASNKQLVTETQAVDAPAATRVDDDDDIPVIPDLEEHDEDDITMTVAEPGSIMNSVLPTNLKLDTGSLPPPQVDGIDLSMLYESIMPMKQLQGEVENWDPDVMLEVLKQEMQEEKDRRESEANAENAAMEAKN